MEKNKRERAMRVEGGRGEELPHSLPLSLPYERRLNDLQSIYNQMNFV